MDVSYARSNITGIKGHLPVQTIKLPLKYPTKTEDKSVNEVFHASLANSGNIVNLSKLHSTFIDHITYETLNDLKTLVFTPLVSQVTNFELTFQSLQILLPHNIKSSNCVSVWFEKPAEGSEEEGYLIVDLIDENYLFVTLRISLSDFIVENSSKNRFSLNNFKQWGKISIPYSFELRSPPSFMKAIDALNVIISLNDGGLLHLQRSDHLKDFDVHNFNDPTSLLPLNFMSGLFKKDNSNQDIVLEGISSNSVVDLVAINKNVIITLTVSKVLKIWSLESHQQVHQPIDLNDNKKELSVGSSWLTSVSSKHLQVIENTILGKQYLTCHFTTTSNNSKQDHNEMGLSFKVWEIEDFKTQVELVLLDRLSFEPQLPDLLISSQDVEDNSKFHMPIWFVQDFQCEYRGNYINYHILWKSNTSTILVTYKINFDNGAVTSINWSQPDSSNTLMNSASYHDIEYYSNKILNSDRYDYLIVSTSLNIFREHIGLEHVKTNISIREAVIDTLNKASNQNQDLKSCWYKLDSLCEEFKNLSEESLACCITNNSTILSLNINGISIFRKSHYYEGFTHFNQNSNEGRLASILKRLSIVLSPKTYSKVYQSVLNLKTSQLTANQATELYDTFLNTKISADESSSIMKELENIPDVLDIINSLIESRIKPNSVQDIDAFKFNTSSNIGIVTKLNTITTFETIKQSHESILLNLVILFLICEVNDQILLLLNKLIERLSTYVIVDCVFNTCFESDKYNARVEPSNLNNSENSLFWSGLVNKTPTLNYLIRDTKLSVGYDFFYGDVISTYDKFILDIIIELINHGEGQMIKEKFFGKLNQNKIIDRFLIGLVYLINNEPLEFFEIYEKHDFFKFNNDSIKKDLKSKFLNTLTVNSDIKSFLNSIFLNEFREEDHELEKANYFHALSGLSKSQANHARRHSHHQNFILPSTDAIDALDKKGTSNSSHLEFVNNALKFELTAVENLKDINYPSESITSKIETYYLNIFDMALNLSNYELLHECLLNLSSTKESKSYNYKDLMARFINKLILNQHISILLPPNENALYMKQYLLIDSILLELANNELALSNSLKCYEYLYSWRLFGATSSMKSNILTDKRGAAEALYMFITRFKNEERNLLTHNNTIIEDIRQYKLKILELYMIILNCLKSFDNHDDKWIIKSKNADSLAIIKLEELDLEYHEWLRQLEDDLS